MDFTRHYDSIDLDVTPDEELPDYDTATAPAYQVEDYETPLKIYHLQQVNRKHQIFVPLGPSPSSSYKIVYNGASRIFSKKAEMEMIRSSHERGQEEAIGTIRFVNDGPLPWRPRARFIHVGPHGPYTHTMESKNFADWALTIEGITYIWALEGRPTSLVLSERRSNLVVARFTYSAQGTLAKDGAQIGELVVYRDAVSIAAEGIEKIMCGLLVSISHLRKMGRHYWNEVVPNH